MLLWLLVWLGLPLMLLLLFLRLLWGGGLVRPWCRGFYVRPFAEVLVVDAGGGEEGS